MFLCYKRLCLCRLCVPAVWLGEVSEDAPAGLYSTPPAVWRLSRVLLQTVQQADPQQRCENNMHLNTLFLPPGLWPHSLTSSTAGAGHPVGDLGQQFRPLSLPASLPQQDRVRGRSARDAKCRRPGPHHGRSLRRGHVRRHRHRQAQISHRFVHDSFMYINGGVCHTWQVWLE